jgi:hypothetical protein
MIRCAEMRHDEPICQAAPAMGIGFRVAMRDYARHIVLASLVAGSLLLLPNQAEAAAQASTPANAGVATSSAGSVGARVSPYAIANRQRAAASRPAHLPMLQLAVRGPHKSVSRGQ